MTIVLELLPFGLIAESIHDKDDTCEELLYEDVIFIFEHISANVIKTYIDILYKFFELFCMDHIDTYLFWIVDHLQHVICI